MKNLKTKNLKHLSILLCFFILGCKDHTLKGVSESPREESALEESFDSIRAARGLEIQGYNTTTIDSLSHLCDSLRKELVKCQKHIQVVHIDHVNTLNQQP